MSVLAEFYALKGTEVLEIPTHYTLQNQKVFIKKYGFFI
jgi:hypothetical protein